MDAPMGPSRGRYYSSHALALAVLMAALRPFRAVRNALYVASVLAAFPRRLARVKRRLVAVEICLSSAISSDH